MDRVVFMRIFSTAAIAAVLLGAVSPALAASKGDRPAASPPPSIQAPAAPSSDPTTQLVSEMAQYSAAYQTVLGDASLFFSEFMDGAGRYLSADKPDKARIDSWIADMRGRLAALRARRAALGPPPASLVQRLKTSGTAEDLAALNDMGKQMGDAIDAVLDLCDQVLALAPDVAQGDPGAQLKLAKTLQRGARTALQSENAMMEGGLAQLDSGHPQGAILRSILASNRALIALLDLGVLLQDDPKADPTPLVKQLQESLVKARTEALSAGPLARRAIAQLKDTPADDALKARVLAAMDTYDASGRVEVQIVDILEALLQAEDPAKAQSLNDELQSLVQQRLKLQSDRQALLAG